MNAMSSTEAYLITTVTFVNTARFLSYVLWELGFYQDCLIPIYKDNDPTIDIVNSIIPTEKPALFLSSSLISKARINLLIE